MAVFTILLGVIYSRIFSMDIAVYLPFVALGLIVWSFISSTTMESANSFTDNAGIIRQIRLPFSVFVMRTVWRAFIVFLHTIVLIIPIALYFRLPIDMNTFLFVPGLILLFINQVWVSVVIAIVSTRFRDIPLLIATALQILMFASPIMWPVSALRDAQFVAAVNPIYHLMEIVRGPLLGETPPLLSWLVVIMMCVCGLGLAAMLLTRASRRIVYWL